MSALLSRDRDELSVVMDCFLVLNDFGKMLALFMSSEEEGIAVRVAWTRRRAVSPFKSSSPLAISLRRARHHNGGSDCVEIGDAHGHTEQYARIGSR